MNNVSVLVVEDDDYMRDILSDLLENAGAKVFRATNGKEAITYLEREKIDLVLSDVQMPMMGGVELLKLIREKNKEIPVVLLVSGHSDLSEESAIALGAIGLLHKPYNVKTLFERLHSILPQS